MAWAAASNFRAGLSKSAQVPLPALLALLGSLTPSMAITRQITLLRRGHERPLTQNELVKKFTPCLRYSRRPFSEENIERIVALYANLEDIKNISTLTEALTA